MWIYKLDKSYTYISPLLKDISFENEWGNIRNGVLTIYKGYAWDGCTPKISISKTMAIGVWDGPLGEDGKPMCYYPTLVHDFFCQFKNTIPITKDTTIQIFKTMMKDSGFIFYPLYVFAVKIFGPQKFKGDVSEEAP